MDAPRLQLEHEQGVERHQSARGPDLSGEKVGRHEGGPMRAEKRAPGGRPRATGWDAFCLQDARNRGSSHAMAHVLQRPLNPSVTLTRILCGHPHHQAPNLCEHAWSPRSPPDIGPFPRNQFTMPSKNRIGRHERGHLSQCGASEPEHRETPPLPIVQVQTASANWAFSTRFSSRRKTITSRSSRSSHPSSAVRSNWSGSTR